MQYDFEKLTHRQDTLSMKWDVGKNELPMWVADMDFETAPCIQQGIFERAKHGVFGYNIVPDSWKSAYINWWKRRYQFTIEPDWLMFCTGVVPAISSIVRKLTTPGENVLIMTPVYNIFFNSILNSGRTALQYELEYENGRYHIDFEKLEEKLKNPQTSMMIFCNPHNPTGIIWDKNTLKTIGDLCKKHGVIVLSDEIHCDLCNAGKHYTPFASASKTCQDISITCIAPTKCFNIAGLQTSAISVPNPFLRHKVYRTINTDEVAEPNSFAIIVAETAFQYGEEWLEQLRVFLTKQKEYATNYICEHIKELYVVPSDATYLLWIDCSKITENTKIFADFIRKQTGLYLSEGSQFGGNGSCFLRMNVATQTIRLQDGLQRLEQAVQLWNQNKTI